MQVKVFGIKIRKLVDGKYLYSVGGHKPLGYLGNRGWTHRGKVWVTEGCVKSYLTMLQDQGYKQPKRLIPEDWEVVTMYEDGTVSVQSARELAERPTKK